MSTEEPYKGMLALVSSEMGLAGRFLKTKQILRKLLKIKCYEKRDMAHNPSGYVITQEGI